MLFLRSPGQQKHSWCCKSSWVSSFPPWCIKTSTSTCMFNTICSQRPPVKISTHPNWIYCFQKVLFSPWTWWGRGAALHSVTWLWCWVASSVAVWRGEAGVKRCSAGRWRRCNKGQSRSLLFAFSLLRRRYCGLRATEKTFAFRPCKVFRMPLYIPQWVKFTNTQRCSTKEKINRY